MGAQTNVRCAPRADTREPSVMKYRCVTGREPSAQPIAKVRILDKSPTRLCRETTYTSPGLDAGVASGLAAGSQSDLGLKVPVIIHLADGTCLASAESSFSSCDDVKAMIVVLSHVVD